MVPGFTPNICSLMTFFFWVYECDASSRQRIFLWQTPLSLSLCVCVYVCIESSKVSEKQKANLSYDSIAVGAFLDAALDCVNPN